jgi:hypothetical protein
VATGRRVTADLECHREANLQESGAYRTTAVAETRVAFTPPMVTVTDWPATGGGLGATTPSFDGGEVFPIAVANNVQLLPGGCRITPGSFGSWFGLRAAARPVPV